MLGLGGNDTYLVDSLFDTVSEAAGATWIEGTSRVRSVAWVTLCSVSVLPETTCNAPVVKLNVRDVIALAR